MPKPITSTEQLRIKKWLRDRGHPSAKINAKRWTTEDDKARSIYELHGIERVP